MGAEHTRGSHSRRRRPLSSQLCPSRSRTPSARPAALTAARAPQPRALPSAGTTEARGGRGAPSGFPLVRPPAARALAPGSPSPPPLPASREGRGDTHSGSPQPRAGTARLPGRGALRRLSEALERSGAAARRGGGGAGAGTWGAGPGREERLVLTRRRWAGTERVTAPGKRGAQGECGRPRRLSQSGSPAGV